MPEIMYSPSTFVDYLTKPGLTCLAGNIPLTQYLSSTDSNGDNENAKELQKHIRRMKEGGTGGMLNDIVGPVPMSLAAKGQGAPETFIQIWDFLIRNKERLKGKKIEFRPRRVKGVQQPVDKSKSGDLYELYFSNGSDEQALNRMVADRFFGIDCIGFCGLYLVWAEIRSKYEGWIPDLWPNKICKDKVMSLEAVRPCDFLVFQGQGHIVAVDYLNEDTKINDTTISIDICQSSSFGPKTSKYCTLSDMKTNGVNGGRLFKLAGDIPVQGLVTCHRIKDWWW